MIFPINDVDDIVVFLGLNVINSDNFEMSSCSINTQATIKNNQFKIKNLLFEIQKIYRISLNKEYYCKIVVKYLF